MDEPLYGAVYADFPQITLLRNWQRPASERRSTSRSRAFLASSAGTSSSLS